MRSVLHQPVLRATRLRRIVLVSILALFCLLMLHPTPGNGALQTARMQLPDGFEAVTERIPASGYGGRNKGQFALGPYRGDFRRVESRWGIFDPLYAAKRAKSSFTLSGPGFDEPVAADCAMKEGSVTIGIVAFEPQKMTYQCTFRQGAASTNASFVLAQAKHKSAKDKMLARADRRGEAVIDSVTIGIRSVHAYRGTSLSSPTPVGYLLQIDDRSIAAIELTDVNPTLYLPADATGPHRRAALVTLLALSVLRDPADSSLGE